MAQKLRSMPEAFPDETLDTTCPVCSDSAACLEAKDKDPLWIPLQGCETAKADRCPLADQHHSIRDYIAINKPAIGRMLRGTFEITTLQEAEKLATMLASHCPNPDMASVGIWELLANAIEHGNLEIDFALKSALLMQGRHHAEIERRLRLPQYRHRVVNVVFQQNRRTIRLRITDEGPGFDFETVLKTDRPALAPNGRGLMLARTMTFTRIRFIGKGNVVDAIIDLEKMPSPMA